MLFNLTNNLLAAEPENPLIKVVPHKLFELWGIPVSNHMVLVGIATILLLIVLPLAGRKPKDHVPRGLRNLIETICVFFREDVARPFLGDSTDKHIGFIWTIFFFVLSLNLLGLVPIAQIIYLVSGKQTHIEGAATANIYIVGALAFVAFLMIHIAGIRQQGLKSYVVNFVPHVPWPMLPFIYFLEIIGAFVKPFSLAIRLFANMLAGHVLILALFSFIVIFENFVAAAGSVFFVVMVSLLEVFVAFLQAYIFTFLTTIFIGFAVKPEH